VKLYRWITMMTIGDPCWNNLILVYKLFNLNNKHKSERKGCFVFCTFSFLYLYIAPKIFINCLLYSWMRLTCMSKRLFGSMLTPVSRNMYCAKRCLLAILADDHSACKSAFSANFWRKHQYWIWIHYNSKKPSHVQNSHEL
jgi:hypothetical protein